jgi:beta-alanine--pyruvate transaminase
MHIKFTGDCGIVAPALVAEKAHIDEMIGVLRKTLKEM